MPPMEYRKNTVSVVRTVDNVQAACKSNTAIACFTANGIVLLNPCLVKGWYAEAFCHEQAHKNKWRHD